MEAGLKQIEKDPAAFRIDAREVQRRRGLVDGLKSQIGYKEPVYGGGTFVRPAGDMAPSTPMDRLAQQRMVAAEQDVLIDEIADGVDRLHDRAIMINEESTLHKSLLDDMDVDVDKATMGLRQQTKTANKVCGAGARRQRCVRPTLAARHYRRPCSTFRHADSAIDQ